MYVCGGGEEKRKVGATWVVGKKKKKEKRHGEWGLCVRWEKRESEKERRKKMKGTKLNWFYLYVHFIWCKV
jgi:hypothetical protein